MFICSKCNQEKTQDNFYYSKGKRNRYCKSCISNYVKDNKERFRYRKYLSSIKNLYNLTKEQYEQLLKEQDNKCKVCGDQTKLFVDHCHNTNNVRGLLCIKCNSMIGYIEKNPQLYDLCKQYLSFTVAL